MSFCAYPNNWLQRSQTVWPKAFLLSLILGATVLSSGSGTADDGQPSSQAATPAAPDRVDGDAPPSSAASGSSATAISDGTAEAQAQSDSQASAAADRHRRLLLVLILRSGSWHVSPFPK